MLKNKANCSVGDTTAHHIWLGNCPGNEFSIRLSTCGEKVDNWNIICGTPVGHSIPYSQIQYDTSAEGTS